jgi:hypothetical protein
VETLFLQKRHLRKGDVDCEVQFYEEGSRYVIDVRYGALGVLTHWAEFFHGINREKAFQAYSAFLGQKIMVEGYWDVGEAVGVIPTVKLEGEKKVVVRKIRWRD